MPVEIRELIVKATVQDNAAEPTASKTMNKEEIVKACVEQVMRIIKEQTER